VTGHGERGAATPLAVALLGLLLFIGAALGVVTAIVHANRQAQSAADLAALAGAAAHDEGRDGCGAAARVAKANGSALSGCAVEGRDVRVQVTVEGPHWLGQTADLTAEARAGPA
jgi:secretion/DNA translocation related TadE-like protein